jgi:hypothetical protein
VDVPPDEIGARKAGRVPASLELDFTSAEFSSLRLPGPVDLDGIQILRYDSTTGKVLPASLWPFARSPGELAFRFLDKSLAPAGKDRLSTVVNEVLCYINLYACFY